MSAAIARIFGKTNLLEIDGNNQLLIKLGL
jgi:hypothetical protein